MIKGILPNDKDMPYPRVCAHRGFNTIAPENTMPAFAASIALGAEEIEFDHLVNKGWGAFYQKINKTKQCCLKSCETALFFCIFYEKKLMAPVL